MSCGTTTGDASASETRTTSKNSVCKRSSERTSRAAGREDLNGPEDKENEKEEEEEEVGAGHAPTGNTNRVRKVASHDTEDDAKNDSDDDSQHDGTHESDKEDPQQDPNRDSNNDSGDHGRDIPDEIPSEDECAPSKDDEPAGEDNEQSDEEVHGDPGSVDAGDAVRTKHNSVIVAFSCEEGVEAYEHYDDDGNSISLRQVTPATVDTSQYPRCRMKDHSGFHIEGNEDLRIR